MSVGRSVVGRRCGAHRAAPTLPREGGACGTRTTSTNSNPPGSSHARFVFLALRPTDVAGIGVLYLRAARCAALFHSAHAAHRKLDGSASTMPPYENANGRAQRVHCSQASWPRAAHCLWDAAWVRGHVGESCRARVPAASRQPNAGNRRTSCTGASPPV